jgi:SAM-dependent methyltransferase
MHAYTRDVYRMMRASSGTSARRIAPMLFELVRPATVVDFGCGTGDWLAAFQRLGSVEVLGLDGPWVDRSLLAVPESNFRVTDLCEPVPLPHQYDIALCLEVVGHVPRSREAALFDSLTAAAPVVVFSGPIPPQQGIGADATNREWPAYWAGRFRERGFTPIDCIRFAVWDDPDVAWWFRQNLFVAVRRELLPRYPLLSAEHARGGGLLSLVHPECCEASVLEASRLRNVSLGRLARGAAAGLVGQVRSRVRGRPQPEVDGGPLPAAGTAAGHRSTDPVANGPVRY